MKKLLVGSMLAVSLLFAGQGDYKAELTGTVGGVMPEGNLDLDDQLSFGLRFGTYVEDKFFDMVEFGYERVNSADYENSSSDTNINRFFVDIVKEYDLNKDTALYSLVGVGYENIRNPLFENEDDGFVQYGLGLKHWINENFALKAEARHAITFEGNNNLFYTLGFVVPFGKKEQPLPVVQEEKVEPAPVVVMEPKKEEPKPVVIDNDTDKDGVLNAQDKCPNTPKGVVVSADGCVKLIRLHVNFDYDKYDVKSQEMEKINQVIEFMKLHNDYSVVLDGHTDSKGSEAYNDKLAKKRADAVAAVLVNSGIAQDKITTNSFGELKPVATNDTDEGRAQNRRVDAHFEK
jgi:OOP family OmpA-OmpF porin